jgi:hypothetical protein
MPLRRILLIQVFISNRIYDLISSAVSFVFVFLWRYNPNVGPWPTSMKPPFHFGFLDLRQSVGLLGRVISSSQGLYLYPEKLNSVAFSPQANYTDRATAACRRS